MKINRYFYVLALTVFISLAACNGNSGKTALSETETKEMKKPAIKEEAVKYAADSTDMIGFVAYDSATDKKRPVVLIVHEWWGLNDYAKSRARALASLGYLAIAVDMYGNGTTADNPELAGKLAGPFYQNPQMAKKRFDAALAKIKTFAVADTNQVAAIGYCFGGAQVINLAKLGENFKGIVSFHGNLVGVPADKNLLKAPMLICHGADDQFVKAEEVTLFKKQMDSIGAVYTFKSYAGATHAFTNPNATAMGEKFKIPIAYNAAADSASWKDMNEFFGKIFE
ncbi:MAG: dienelactone hydrolase family protein [Ferruginibacter sp.]|nr:dienelactone hydrolase family protein [Ferruginibacter sp.]